MGVPGYPAGTEITPEGYLYTGSAEIVFRYGARQRPWNVRIRTLEDGRYPIFTSHSGSGGVSYTLTTFAGTVGGIIWSAIGIFSPSNRPSTMLCLSTP